MNSLLELSRSEKSVWPLFDMLVIFGFMFFFVLL